MENGKRRSNSFERTTKEVKEREQEKRRRMRRKKERKKEKRRDESGGGRGRGTCWRQSGKRGR